MTSFARTPDEVRTAFAALKTQCDPRGYSLLDSLEKLALQDNAIIALHERLLAVETDNQFVVGPDDHSRKAPAALRVVGGGQSDRGLSLGDPKLVGLDNLRGLR